MRIRIAAPRPGAVSAGALALVAAFVAGLVAGPVAAHATETPLAATGSTTWTLAPATDDGADGRVSLRHEIDPGSAVDDRVELTNFSDHAATFAVYASDGLVTASGDFDLLPADVAPERGGSWITLSSPEAPADPDGRLTLTLDAGASAVISARIAVPASATPGDHPAGIVAQLVPDDDGAVQLASRVGVRAHLRVAGDIIPTVAPDGIRAEYVPSWNPFAPGTVRLSVDVRNEGNVRLGAHTRASIAGIWGLAGTSADDDVREILPGDGVERAIELEAWPLVFGWGELRTTPLIVGEDTVDETPTATTVPFAVWTIPWSQLVLAVLVVGAVLLVRRLRRRSAARLQAHIDAAVAAARDETPIQSSDDDERAAAVDSRTTSSG